MLRYNGDNVEEYGVPSEDKDHDLVPTSLDKDFQLSELFRCNNNTHCALNDDTLRLQHQLEIHSPAKVRMPIETQVRQSRNTCTSALITLSPTERLVKTPKLLKFGRN